MSIINREEFIKSLIKDAGLTTKEFAQKINIPYTTLLSILNRSIGGASVDNVIKICQGLNIKVDDLRTLETNNDTFDVPPLLSKIEQNLIKKYRALTPEGKNTVDLILDNQYEQVKPKVTDAAM